MGIITEMKAKEFEREQAYVNLRESKARTDKELAIYKTQMEKLKKSEGTKQDVSQIQVGELKFFKEEIEKLRHDLEETTRIKSEALKLNEENLKKHVTETQILKSDIEKLKEQNLTLETDNKNLTRKLGVEFSDNYDNTWSWADKIVFVLKQAQRPLRSREIMESLCKVESRFSISSDLNKLLSVHLNRAVKYGQVIGKRQTGKNGYLFSLPEMD